jgi:hypothetical protein
MRYSEKTIPYRLSPAELENLRLLRKRTHPSGSVQDDEEDKASEERDAMKTTTPKTLREGSESA